MQSSLEALPTALLASHSLYVHVSGDKALYRGATLPIFWSAPQRLLSQWKNAKQQSEIYPLKPYRVCLFTLSKIQPFTNLGHIL